MKKFFCTVLIISIINSLYCFCIASNQNITPTTYPMVDSQNAISMEINSGKILFYKNPFDKVAVASTTKIMTACLVLENADLKKVVEVSAKAAFMGGSRMGLKKGQKITISDLLYGLMLHSGNDASIALAESVSGNVTDFVSLMNKKARELNLKSTNFVTPHGLDNDMHYSSAFDLAILTKYALLNSKFCEIISQKGVNIAGKYYSNTNPLLGVYEGVDGVKTGYTSKAGRCVVLTSIRKGIRVITVVLNAQSNGKRREDAIKIMNYVYDNFNRVEVVKKDETVMKLPVLRGRNPFVDVVVFEDVYSVLCKKEMETAINNLEIKKNLTAPIKKGEIVGNIMLSVSGDEVIPITLCAKEDVNLKTTLDFFLENITMLIEELV